jgi:hypothetical protein
MTGRLSRMQAHPEFLVMQSSFVQRERSTLTFKNYVGAAPRRRPELHASVQDLADRRQTRLFGELAIHWMIM